VFPIVFALAACGGEDPQTDSDAGESSSGAEAGSSSSSGDPGDTSEASSSGGPMQTGEELFLGYCAGCHGVDALGTVLAYELRHPNREYAEWVVRNGRAAGEFAPSFMAAFSTETISDEELQLVFDHLDSFPQPTTGQGLYEDYCGNCHGPDGSGGAVAENILEEPAEALEQVREGDGGTNYGARSEFMPAFADDRLTNAEFQSIMDYLLAL
jgi:mono/diheme cytochrome c family protein